MLLLVEQVDSKRSALNPEAEVWQDGGGQSDAAGPASDRPGGGDGPGATLKPDSGSTGNAVSGMESPQGEEGTVPGSRSPAEGEVETDRSGGNGCDLRETLRKQLEFCFSRENLARDAFLSSNMDSEDFVPIWTIANMETIRKLTTDLQLIRQALQSSPMLQLDEGGDRVRPNSCRCIVILREVPEATPVEDVQLLFQGSNCPRALSCEFVHNNTWYVSFRSDSEAQQAFHYLRNEVKTFHGKPILARIKAQPMATNTFQPRNGYRGLGTTAPSDRMQPTHLPPLFIHPLYSPPHTYPLYNVLPHQPYFEIPLAPFANRPHMKGFSSDEGCKATPQAHTSQRSHYGNWRGAYRGRRRREDDRYTKPPPFEFPTSKVDLAPLNFPPLPGPCPTSPPGESAPEIPPSHLGHSITSNSGSAIETQLCRPAPAPVDIPENQRHLLPEPTHPRVNVTDRAELRKPSHSSPIDTQAESCTKTSPSDSPSDSPLGDRPHPLPTSEPRKLSYAEVCQKAPPQGAHKEIGHRDRTPRGDERGGGGGRVRSEAAQEGAGGAGAKGSAGPCPPGNRPPGRDPRPGRGGRRPQAGRGRSPTIGVRGQGNGASLTNPQQHPHP